jgi:putative ABC transport system permease protein
MRKRPGVTTVAVLTLALGLGANTAIFSVINGVLLKPLPYRSSDRLIHVTIAGNTGFGDRTSLPMSDFLAWQAANRSCDAVAVYTTDQVAVSGAGEADQVVGGTASAAFFDTFGAQPALGRFWRDGDDRPGAPLTVVISYAFWEQHLRASREAIGKTLLIDAQPHEVIGVAPPGFAFPGADVQLWSVERLDPPARRGPYYLRGVGRLKAGASIASVRADLARAQAEVRNRFPSRHETRYMIEPLGALITGEIRPVLLLLAGAVTLVLVIAVGNVANLLLVGAAERERELALRAALGAGRRRLLVQLFMEGLVLAGAGAAAAWMVAIWTTRALVAVGPQGLPRLADIQMDAHVFGFTLIASLVGAMVFGIVPALYVSDRGLLEAVQSGTRASARPAARRFRNGLIVGEIALALTVAVMAALLAKSLARLQHVSVGTTAEHVLTASVVPPAARYPRERVTAVFDDLLGRVETVPGVVATGVTNSLPPDGLSLTDNFLVEDRLPSPDQGAPVGPLLVVSEDYFRTLGVPPVRGRWFNRFDSAASMPVAVISEAMAKEHFAGLDPIGRRLKNASDVRSPNPWRTVVGVVADVKYGGMSELAAPALYVPLQQAPSRHEYLVVRTTGDPAAVVSRVRDALHAIDPDLPLGEVHTLDERLWEATAPARFRTGLMALFGTMALVLAAIGIYGVIAYSVTQRTRELGVRMALGADRGDVLRMVVKETAQLAGLGTAIGFVLALGAGRLMTAMLFAVSPSDGVIFIGTSAFLLLVALASGFLPAWRAAATDPVVALRAE